jgi:hypothetical protein
MRIWNLTWLAIVLEMTSPARSDEFKEETTFFRVTIGGHVFRLEGLVVKRADAVGRLPIALITHGWPPKPQACSIPMRNLISVEA